MLDQQGLGDKPKVSNILSRKKTDNTEIETHIWFFVERRNQEGDWECVAGDFCVHINGKHPYIDLKIGEHSKLKIDQSYDLFYALAGGGYRDGDPQFNRGLPNDVTTEVRRESLEWDWDAHYRHWYSLRELLDFDWTLHARCGQFKNVTIPALQAVGDPDGVRVIFWFHTS